MAKMDVRWKNVGDPDEFVGGVLSAEAGDIPRQLVTAHGWCLDDVPLERITVDGVMIERHDHDDIHVQRRDAFIGMMLNGEEVYPLIVMGPNFSLVDGYARYRACKKLGVGKVRVARQILSIGEQISA